MTAADDYATKLRARDRVARPVRIAALAVTSVALGIGVGPIVVAATLIATPAAMWGLAAADRYRYRRNLGEGVIAAAAAGMHRAGGFSPLTIGTLRVEREGIRWTPARRFRKRGVSEVFAPWRSVSRVTSAPVTPVWIRWIVRSDVLAFERFDGPDLALSVTSPQVIYRALGEMGHPVVGPPA